MSLLNFQHVTNKVFEGQLAFNILPEQDASEKAEKRIMEQIVRILGDSFPRPLITAAQVPVFHSHVYSMFVHLRRDPDCSRTRDRFRSGEQTCLRLSAL